MNSRFNLVRVLLGVIVSFLGVLTVANAPYSLAGYGLSAFALFVIGYVFPAREAYVSFIIGNTLGVALGAYTNSLFLFVAIGAAFVRPIQLFLLVHFKEKIGLLGATFLALMFEILVATGVGLLTYGSGGIMSSFSLFDVIYVIPAYLAFRLKTSDMSSETRNLGYVAAVAGVFTAFVSASAFLLPFSLIIGLVFLLVSALMIMRSRRSHFVLKKPVAVALAVLIVIISSASIYAAQPTSSFALHANFSPLYSESLSKGQWIQTSQLADCRQGNLAGGGTAQTGVWGAERLRVLSTCVTVSGTIVAISPTYGPAVDGDYGIDLKVDPQYTYLLSLGNYVMGSGYLHVEVVPVDQPSVLSGLNLKPGEHVMISGVWVLDTDHGWGSEVHPAWSITIMSG